jgi:hypothetical protein
MKFERRRLNPHRSRQRYKWAAALRELNAPLTQ